MKDSSASKKKKIFFLTGELSGETHASAVLRELNALSSSNGTEIEARALGSELLSKEGAKIVADYNDYCFSGFTKVLLNLGKILSLKKVILEEIRAFEPDILVLVDYAGFNLEIASKVKQDPKLSKTKIIEFIVPQIWASRPWRINKIKQSVDKVLCTLPFEEEIYKEANIPVKYVGNPVLASLPEASSKQNLLEKLASKDEKFKSYSADETIAIGLFPGSRSSEIEYMLPLMIKSAKYLEELFELSIYKHKPLFLLAKASNLPDSVFEKYGLNSEVEGKLIHSLDKSQISNHELLSGADMLWLCSGTVTLEAALYEKPYFLSYKSDWLSYLLYKIVKIIDMAGLANIIAGEYIVKEFLQKDATEGNFVKETLTWLDTEKMKDSSEEPFSNYYFEIKSKLSSLKDKLNADNTPGLVAEEILSSA